VPTSLRIGPYRFYFYSGDRLEPPHTHVERDDTEAKFWLMPTRLAWNEGYSGAELGRLEKLVEENQLHLLKAWNDFFGDSASNSHDSER
jgi:hypothetical protein